MSGICEIYVLRDPLTNEIKYVGKSKDSKKRLIEHLRDSRRRDYPVYRWIRKLAADHLLPVLEVVKKTDDWRTDERELIAVLRARGDGLLNVADGGDQPFCPIEVRRANGAKVAAMRCNTPFAKRIWEMKRAIGQGLRKGYVNNKVRAKLRLAAFKRPDLFGAWLNIPDRVEL